MSALSTDPEVVTFIIAERQRGTNLRDIAKLIGKRFGREITRSHVCKIACNNGMTVTKWLNREAQPCYDRPPFKHRDPDIICANCHTKNKESLDWPGHCMTCAQRAGKLTVHF